jgi:hypothetical protein
MLYFFAIWDGTKTSISQVTSKIRNFFWSGKSCQACKLWKVYYFRRDDGGLNMMDSYDAVMALMAK